MTRAFAAELGVDDAVLMPGRLDIRSWLERADVFVHTARWEGFGLVLLEAMLAALPILATRASAIPEVVVVDGQTRRYCRPGRRRWHRPRARRAARGSGAGSRPGYRRSLSRAHTLLGRSHGRSHVGGLRRRRLVLVARAATPHSESVQTSTLDSPGWIASRCDASVTGPAPAPGKVFLTSIWFKGHNNPRYAELLPRLERLDRYLLTCSDARVVRGVQYRALRWSTCALPRPDAPRSPTLSQPLYRGQRADSIVPRTCGLRRGRPVLHRARGGTPRQPEHLAAYVVTAERAGRRFESLAWRSRTT